MKKTDFGSDFYWGVTTAAYQIEGAHDADGKGLSIWDVFSNTKGKIKDKTTGNVACDHYNRYQQDVEIINELNIPNYRFSTSWSRVLPNGIGRVNAKGLDFYDRLTDELLEKGVEPWVTLYHWDLPYALQCKGGWNNRDILLWFEHYAELVVRRLRDRVNNWIVMNEPMVFTGAGHFLGLHAPGKKGFSPFLNAVHHAALAQALGVNLLKELMPNAHIGTTFSCSHVEPLSEKRSHIKAAKRVDAALNRLFIEPLLGLGYPYDELPFLQKIEKYFRPGDEYALQAKPDFIGVQNYTREIAKYAWYVPYMQAQLVAAQKRDKEPTLMGWEVYPESIYEMIKKFASYQGVDSVIITENGAAFTDQVINGQVNDVRRTKYLQDYLAQVLRAKQEGYPVNGYFIWTLLDNFEWAEGYVPRFGIVHNDFKTQQRIIKDSGKWYRDFLA